MKRTRVIPLLGLLAFVGAAAGPDPAAVREAAYRENNVGIGLLEQYRYDDAVASFRKALVTDPGLDIARLNLAVALLYAPDLESARKEAEAVAAGNPSLPQPHYVLGLVAKGQNRPEDAIAEFRKVLALDPSDVGANVNVGQVLLQQRRYDEAVTAFRAAAAGDAFNTTALYNLGIALTRAGNAEEGQKVLERFGALRQSGTGIVFGQTYPDQGRYSEAVSSSGAEASLVDEGTPAVRFVDVTSSWIAGEEGAAKGPAVPGRLALVDFDQDGRLDVVEVGAEGERLLHNEGGRFVDVTKASGLDPASGGTGAVAGDVDGDGKPDLLVLRKRGLALLRNDGGKRFADVTAAAGLASEPAGATAALVDFDHDGDLDIVAGGAGKSHVLRNDGKGVFTDVSEKAGIASAALEPVALVPTDFDNHRDVDLVVVNAKAPPMLFKNLRDGSFSEVGSETGLAKAQGGLLAVAAGDVNKDSYTDFFFGRADGDLLALSDSRLHFTIGPGPGSRGSTTALFLDYDLDGLLDVVTLSSSGLQIFRNLGARWTEVTGTAAPQGLSADGFAAGDLDGDGATDLVLRLPSGAVRVLRNDGGARNHSVRVALTGRASNRNGVGAKVEVRAGSLRQKLESYAATPAVAPADLVFGLGPRAAADAIRILWPSGTLQTETDQARIASAAVPIEELDRKPSSCPYLYAWNGRRYAFVTDFMGGGEMGYQESPGVWNTPIPEEYVRLDGSQLRAKDGRYELRVANELEEALFVDRLRLIAVAHPGDVDVFPNEGMGEAPRPPHRLFAVRGAHPARRAVDDRGRDQRDRIERLDRKFVDGFPLEDVRGYAKEHGLVLDVSDVPADRALLLLTGWTDYAFSSDNVAAHQRGLSLRPPSLEMQDAAGQWVTVIDDVGVPVGRPQTVVVDLSGRWPGRSRLVRVVTNMRIYWDRVLVGEKVEAPVRTVSLDPMVADLRARGFSAEASADGREPYGYDYAQVSLLSPWKAFPGRYTRLGDVRELLSRTDDVYVISRPGDELALSFDATALPPLPAGWTRTYLLHADGFSKEMDINSATPNELGPLPFHGMTRYPYTAPEAYPMTPEKLALMERYNTRVVTRPVAPIEVAVAEARRRDR